MGSLLATQDALPASGQGDLAASARLPRAAWLVAVLLLCQLGFCWAGRSRPLTGAVDFRPFWTTGRLLLEHQGSQIYDLAYQAHRQTELFGNGQTLPFLYPPFMAGLFAPLALPPYRAALALWAVANLLLLAGAVLLLRSELAPLRRIPASLLLGAALCPLPVAMALLQGQISFVLLLIYTASYVLLRRGRDWSAGLLFALALAKFQIALPVLVLMLVWRRVRFAAGMACGAAALAAISMLLVGWTGVRAYITEITGVAHTTALDPATAHLRFGMNAADMPNLHGLLAAVTHGSPLATGLSLLLSAALAVWAARRRPSFPLAMLVGLLVSYHMQAYDLLLLTLPLLTVGAGLLDETLLPRERRFWLAAAALLVVPLAPALLVSKLSCLLIAPVLLLLTLCTRMADSGSPHAHTPVPRSAHA